MSYQFPTSYKLPKLEQLKGSSHRLLSDYKIQQQENRKEYTGYSLMGYDARRLDNIALIQFIISHVDEYLPLDKKKYPLDQRDVSARHVSKFDLLQGLNERSNTVGYPLRERQAIARGRQHIAAGIMLYFCEKLDSERSALCTVLGSNLNLDSQGPMDLDTKLACYSDLHSFLSHDYLKLPEDYQTEVKKIIVDLDTKMEDILKQKIEAENQSQMSHH